MTCHETISAKSRFLHIRQAVLSRVFMHIAITLSMLLLSAQAARSAPLRYQPKADTKFAYEVGIVAELPDSIETSKGVILYEIKSPGEMLKLDYSGGLKSSSKYQGSNRSRFNHPLFRRHFIAIPTFADNKNCISLTPRGKMRMIEGNSQLPYLLGNLSVLIFEPLPEKDQKSWTSKTDISVLETNSSGWRRCIPRPWHGGGPDKTTTGSESASFVFQNETGGLSAFQKTYRLHAAADKESVTIAGSGVWTFNRRLKMPESLDCKYKLTFKENNATLGVPLAVKYRRLSDKELAKYEKEKKEQREKRKAQSEQRLVEQKAPIGDKERRQILADLKSNDTHHLISVLRKLSQKNARDDKEIARDIKRHLKHSSRMVRSAAEDAIVKFAPELGQKIEINKAYSSIHNVDVTGPAVTARTLLPAGLIVAVNDIGPWYKAAKVVRKHNDGQVEVEFIGFHQIKKIHWSKIRLAPREVDQPFVSKRKLAKIYPGNRADDDDVDDTDDDDSFDDDSRDEDTSSTATKADRGYRTWADDTGTFAIIAKYVDTDGDKVCLRRKKDGKTIKVPLSRLSKGDKKVARRLKESPQASNPFEP